MHNQILLIYLLIFLISYPKLILTKNADLSPNELEIAKLYPAHTALCVRDGWEFCRPELAAGMPFSRSQICFFHYLIW